MTAWLQTQGHKVNRKRVARLIPSATILPVLQEIHSVLFTANSTVALTSTSATLKRAAWAWILPGDLASLRAITFHSRGRATARSFCCGRSEPGGVRYYNRNWNGKLWIG